MLGKQDQDGGWSIESLGPFVSHSEAPPSKGSNAYAIAFTCFALETAGVSKSNPSLKRALDWLVSHQDPQSGTWKASSMNKNFAADSMEVRFMQDAATAFASLALLE